MIFVIVSVLIQLSTSFILACRKRSRSSAVRSDNFTSLRCRFAAETRKAISCGFVSSRQRVMSWAQMGISNFQHWSLSTWKTWSASTKSSSSVSGIGTSTGLGGCSTFSEGSWLLGTGSPSGCSELLSLIGITETLGLSSLGIIGIWFTSWLLAVVVELGASVGIKLWYCTPPCGGIMLWFGDVERGESPDWFSLIVDRCCHSSTADSGRRCSGATRYSLLPMVIHTTCELSCNTTRRGPIQEPSASPRFRHIMTWSPWTYLPRLGLLLWTRALLRTWQLSVAVKARRARSRRASSSLNRRPSGRSSMAKLWEGNCISETTEPATLLDFPNTRTSGG